jgi:osmotically-inducible protein OsmY
MPERWDYRNRDDARRYDDDRERRGSLERAGDEVRSWFGDDEAARRRRLDEIRNDQERERDHSWNERDRDRDRSWNERDRDRNWHERDRNPVERAWDRTREAARDVTDRDRDGRRGLSEWNDDDRPYTPPWTGTNYESANRPYDRDRNAPDYRGLGPRGYQRSDTRMFEDICDRLTVDPRVDASDIEVDVKGAEVTLRGSVRSREEKRYAEDVVEHVMGVREVNNHLKVSRSDHVIGTARSGASSPLALTDTPPPPPQPKK